MTGSTLQARRRQVADAPLSGSAVYEASRWMPSAWKILVRSARTQSPCAVKTDAIAGPVLTSCHRQQNASRCRAPGLAEYYRCPRNGVLAATAEPVNYSQNTGGAYINPPTQPRRQGFQTRSSSAMPLLAR